MTRRDLVPFIQELNYNANQKRIFVI